MVAVPVIPEKSLAAAVAPRAPTTFCPSRAVRKAAKFGNDAPVLGSETLSP